ncbi:peptidoglycan recognition protein family protein [Erwinia oleae]|uniref:peptidoglycan recognition protein family protein n=1 Tax=Erwinia oleae TaxID=796334 RepID=UPI000553403E|nr:peptidoglycan recognition family protein [Erwinia oleae]
MLYIDEKGHVDAARIIVKIFKTIERGKLDKVNGIVVHQTDSPTARSTFNSYQNAGANGAHFLIDKDGTIYQTASLFRITWHVGRSRSRCFLTKKCTPAEFKKVADLEKRGGNNGVISKMEKIKKFPHRFPINSDSIGIEIVGQSRKIQNKKETVYEPVNSQQNDSLKWLISELTVTLKVPMDEIYRHPEIARKNETEAGTALW